MLHKIGLGLFCIAASLSTSVYSTENHLLQKGLSVEYELPSNDPQVFINYMFWAIEANCKIHSEDESNEFLVEALSRKGKINGVPILKGESVRINVHPGENLKLNADSGAKVQLTNFGKHTVKATCTTS